MPKRKKSDDKSFTKEHLVAFAKEFADKFTGSFLSDFVERIKDGIHDKIDYFMFRLRQTLVVSALLLVGIIFFLVGLAKVLDSLVGFYGGGYLLLGIFFLLLSFLFGLVRGK